ncbi:MAG: translation initiation factor IF-3, partial [Clostridia bacterium]|nr:translation initiation factor IF-3 [Clostridia bacterium]
MYSVNEAIRDREVRLIGADGEMIGVMSSREAQRLANEADLCLLDPSRSPRDAACSR